MADVRWAGIVMSYRPERDPGPALASLLRSEPAPVGVYLWRNGGQAPGVGGLDGRVVEVHAAANLGCIARYALGALCDAGALVFVDDDAELLSPELAYRLAWAAVQRAAQVGVIGRMLSGAPGAPYSRGEDRRLPGPVDIIKGIIHAAPRALCGAMLAAAVELPHELVWCSEDIALSMVAARAGRDPWLVPCMRGEWRVRRDGCGLEDEPGHWERRDRAVRAWQAAGVRP